MGTAWKNIKFPDDEEVEVSTCHFCPFRDGGVKLTRPDPDIFRIWDIEPSCKLDSALKVPHSELPLSESSSWVPDDCPKRGQVEERPRLSGKPGVMRFVWPAKIFTQED